MDLLRVGGTRLECRWIGPAPDEAPTIVFLHEGLGSVSLWRDFPDALAAASGCGALVYSRAGYGRSDPAPLPRPVRFMHDEAEVLRAILAQSRIREPILLGHSDGASIALIAAGTAPIPGLRALVLEAPHTFAEPCGLESIAKIADVYRTTGLRERLARHHGDNTDVAFWGWNRVWLDPDFRTWNIEDVLPGITVPRAGHPGRERRVRQLEARPIHPAPVERARGNAAPPRLRPRPARRAAGCDAGRDDALHPPRSRSRPSMTAPGHPMVYPPQPLDQRAPA